VDEVASKVKGFGQKLKSGWDELVGSDD
jgi:hypothetical protein